VMSSSKARRAPVVLVAGLLALAGCGGQGAGARPAAVASLRPRPAVSLAAPKPAARDPLTGMLATDPARADRPPLSVKIDNVAGSFPQAGLNQADLVADVLVEGGLTRLFATFQSQDAVSIGPIRSARPVDADLLRLFGVSGGIFVYSGAATGEIAPTIAHGNALRLSMDNGAPYFHRVGNYAAPHDVFSSTAQLYAGALTLDPHLGPPRSVFSYSTRVPAGTVVRQVTLPFSTVSSAGWTWTGRQYLRTQNGSADMLTDGSQVSTTNVVIMSAAVAGTGIFDQAGNQDPLDVIIGSGQCWVLRDGRLVRGTWERPGYGDPMRLVDAAGHVITLRPGRTWLEVLPRPEAPAFS